MKLMYSIQNLFYLNNTVDLCVVTKNVLINHFIHLEVFKFLSHSYDNKLASKKQYNKLP